MALITYSPRTYEHLEEFVSILPAKSYYLKIWLNTERFREFVSRTIGTHNSLVRKTGMRRTNVISIHQGGYLNNRERICDHFYSKISIFWRRISTIYPYISTD